MGKQISFDYSGITIADAYVMIGETRVNHFHESVQIDVYVFASEAARRQDPTLNENLRRPLQIITVVPSYQHYVEFMEANSDALLAAIYQQLSQTPEGIAVNPAGLQEMFADGLDV